jgi:hypothetical protein
VNVVSLSSHVIMINHYTEDVCPCRSFPFIPPPKTVAKYTLCCFPLFLPTIAAENGSGRRGGI